MPPSRSCTPRKHPHIQAAVLLLGCALVVYWPLLAPGRVPVSVFSDVPAFHLGLKQAVVAALERHELPLWHSDQMMGGPLLTQPQSLVLHPLQLLFLAIDPAQAFGATFFFELWVGAVGAYFLGRALDCAWPSSVLAGVAQLVCFKLLIAVYAGWSPVLAVLVTLPWVAAAVFRLARAPGLPSWLGLSASLTVALSGGAPQTLYYLLLVLGGYGPVAALRARTSGLRPALGQLGALASALLVAGGSTAYLWLPVFDDLPLLSRRRQSYAFFLSGHGLSREALGTWFSPELLGSPRDRSYPGVELWEDVAYFGLLPWLGVSWVALRVWRVDLRRRWLLLAFALSAALSLDTPLLAFVHATVPGYALFRLPNRMLFVTALLGIALFALAAQDAWSWLAARSARSAVTASVACAAVMLAEGAQYARAYLTTEDVALLHAPADHPARGLSRPGGLRGAVFGRGSFNYGWASDVGLDLVNAYDPYHFWYLRDYLQLVVDGKRSEAAPEPFLDIPRLARPDLLRDLAVGFVLSKEPMAGPDFSPLSMHRAVRNFVFYRGQRVAPLHVSALRDARARVRFAQGVSRVASLEEMSERLAREPARGQAYVLEADAPPTHAMETSSDSLRETARGPGHVTVRVHSAAPRLVIFSELFHPGWEARVDGIAARPLQTNLTLLGVWAPAGVHTLTLRFWPRRFGIALALSAACGSTLLGLALYILRRGRPTRSGAGS